VSTQTKPTKSTASSLLELVVIVVVALGLALAIQAFIVKPYRIPSSSMEPTLTIGQRVLVNRIGTHFSDPHVGEVVVFHPPSGADQNVSSCRVAVQPGSLCNLSITKRSGTNFIKRVVAGPGDSISIQNGHVIRNGKPEADGYIRPCGGGSACTFSKPITIPAGYYFMMGDNRGESFDSRFWGPVPLKWIIGGAFATYWPPKRIGFL
jgi:signal peptidase I